MHRSNDAVQIGEKRCNVRSVTRVTLRCDGKRDSRNHKVPGPCARRERKRKAGLAASGRAREESATIVDTLSLVCLRRTTTTCTIRRPLRTANSTRRGSACSLRAAQPHRRTSRPPPGAQSSPRGVRSTRCEVVCGRIALDCGRRDLNGTLCPRQRSIIYA